MIQFNTKTHTLNIPGFNKEGATSLEEVWGLFCRKEKLGGGTMLPTFLDELILAGRGGNERNIGVLPAISLRRWAAWTPGLIVSKLVGAVGAMENVPTGLATGLALLIAVGGTVGTSCTGGME
jgi:hypothetical protein